jgi:phage I-like protein
MWIDLLASGASEGLAFRAFLSDVGDSGQIQMPVAITGRWVHPANQKKIVITANDLLTATRNFRKKGNGEINVDYDHASEIPNFAGGPRPSAGRVVALRGPEPYTDSQGTPREILWGNYEPTEMARGMIRKREYRYISPVLARERVDKATGVGQGMTITTIALTNTPVLEEMPGIFACSEGGEVMEFAEVEWPKRWEPQQSAGSRNANDELTRLANERALKDGLGFQDAFLKVAHENPELARQAREAAIMDAPTQWGKVKSVPTQTTGVEHGMLMGRMASDREKEKGISYQAALSEVCRENPELAREYQRHIGRED